MTFEAFGDFIQYIGDADKHDGYIRKIEVDRESVRVKIERAWGKSYAIEFDEVEWIQSRHPEDMMLCAISEWKSEGSISRFVFVNWEDTEDASLEIGAKGYRVLR